MTHSFPTRRSADLRTIVRKTLLATTALAAATGLVAIASPASAAEKLSVKIGGYFQAYYGYFDVENNDNVGGGDYRSHDFFREAEINFKGEVALDNGMKVGLDVQLAAETRSEEHTSELQTLMSI